MFNVKQLPDENGKLCEAAKARLMARGFQQIEGIDYSETFAPVIKFTTIRLLLALVAHFDLELHQMDVVTAFLNGDLDEDIYMEQPEGCADGANPDFVCKLLKAIYGLKQAHRQWHYKIDSLLLIHLGFKKTRSDPCLYIKREGNSVMIIALYVDDLLLAGSDLDAILWMKGELKKRFEMKDLGEAKVCIGLEIHRNRGAGQLWLGQRKYAESVLERFHMSKCNPSSTPMDHRGIPPSGNAVDPPTSAPYRQAIGCLMLLYWRYGCMRACDPMLYGGMWYMSSENQSCFSRWAAFERSAIYHTFGSFVTSGSLAHKPYTTYVLLAYDWLIMQTMQPDWHRARVHMLCGTATLVHCCMTFCTCTHCCITALCMTILLARVSLSIFTCVPRYVSAV